MTRVPIGVMNRAPIFNVFFYTGRRGRPLNMTVPPYPPLIPLLRRIPRHSLGFRRRGVRRSRYWADWDRYLHRIYMRDWRAGRFPPAPHA